MAHPTHILHINCELGILQLEANENQLIAVQFTDEACKAESTQNFIPDILKEADKQFDEYFQGSRTHFELPLKLNGTPFQQSVWKELSHIPYGTTITYKQLAQQLGDAKKIRAAGRANGKNPLSIIIPCHRVIGANNNLIGYAGGIERKRWLLQHEGSILL